MALISLFKDFKDMTGEADADMLRENEALEHHALLVMSIIDEAICHIDEVDRVIELCTRVGATHSRFTGFTSDLFWNIEEPFLHAVKNQLGDRYSDSMHEAYEQIIKLVLSNLESGMIQGRERKTLNNENTILPKYCKAKTTKSQLKRQISLSKQEEFFGKDYDRDKIAEILRQESLEREYLKGEPRQSTSGLQDSAQNSKAALGVISDKSPMSEHPDEEQPELDESQEIKDSAPLLQENEPEPAEPPPKMSAEDNTEIPKKADKTGGDKQPLLQDADDHDCANDVHKRETTTTDVLGSTNGIQNLRSTIEIQITESSQSETCDVGDFSGEAEAPES